MLIVATAGILTMNRNFERHSCEKFLTEKYG